MQNNAEKTPNVTYVIHNERTIASFPALPTTWDEAMKQAQTIYDQNREHILAQPEVKARVSAKFWENGAEGGYWDDGEARDDVRTEIVQEFAEALTYGACDGFRQSTHVAGLEFWYNRAVVTEESLRASRRKLEEELRALERRWAQVAERIALEDQYLGREEVLRELRREWDEVGVRIGDLEVLRDNLF